MNTLICSYKFLFLCDSSCTNADRLATVDARTASLCLQLSSNLSLLRAHSCLQNRTISFFLQSQLLSLQVLSVSSGSESLEVRLLIDSELMEWDALNLRLLRFCLRFEMAGDSRCTFCLSDRSERFSRLVLVCLLFESMVNINIGIGLVKSGVERSIEISLVFAPICTIMAGCASSTSTDISEVADKSLMRNSASFAILRYRLRSFKTNTHHNTLFKALPPLLGPSAMTAVERQIAWGINFITVVSEEERSYRLEWILINIMQQSIRRQSLQLSHSNKSSRKKRWYLSDFEEDPETFPVSPAKVQNSYTKTLVKNNSHIESNILKFKESNPRSKSTQMITPEGYTSRKSSLSTIERLLVLQSMEKGYNLFKTVNSTNTNPVQKPKHVKLEPITKTIQNRKSPTKGVEEQVQELKKRKMKGGIQRLDEEIRENGKLAPLRLVISNKIRNKIIKDLMASNEKTIENVQHILQRQDEQEWIPDFQELKKKMDLRQKEAKKRHNQQMVSRSIYNNAYYQFLAMDKDHREQFLRKAKKVKRPKQQFRQVLKREMKSHESPLQEVRSEPKDRYSNRYGQQIV